MTDDLLKRAEDVIETSKHLQGKHDQSTHAGGRTSPELGKFKKDVLRAAQRRYGFNQDTIKRIFPNDKSYQSAMDKGLSPEKAMLQALRDWV